MQRIDLPLRRAGSDSCARCSIRKAGTQTDEPVARGELMEDDSNVSKGLIPWVRLPDRFISLHLHLDSLAIEASALRGNATVVAVCVAAPLRMPLMHSAQHKTAIVTVTYNSSAVIETFLRSTLDAAQAPAVVIAENASPDAEQTKQIVEKLGATFLRLEENLGYGAAVNAAIETLDPDYEYVLISNPDVIATPGLVAGLESWLDAHPRTAAVGPRILNEDGSVYPSARALPSLRTGVGHALFANVWPTNPWTRHYRFEGQYTDEPRSAEWLSGACLMVRRTAFDEVGGFDSGYFMYFEDVDLGQRLGAAGWTNQYVPTASATHLGAVSTSTASERMLEAHHRSAARYLDMRYPGALRAPLRLAIRAGLAIRLRLLSRG